MFPDFQIDTNLCIDCEIPNFYNLFYLISENKEMLIMTIFIHR